MHSATIGNRRYVFPELKSSLAKVSPARSAASHTYETTAYRQLADAYAWGPRAAATQP
jgi:hypothetical protein